MALAWKAGWVHALTSSNLVSSATDNTYFDVSANFPIKPFVKSILLPSAYFTEPMVNPVNTAAARQEDGAHKS